jgi:hypothetical protein
MSTRSLITIPLSTKWTVNTTYQYRKLKTTLQTGAKPMILFRIDYKFHPKISYTRCGLLSKFNTTQYNQLLINTYFKAKPFKLQDLRIWGGTKFQLSLIDKQIATNNYYLNYNMGTNFNFGWFTQYFCSKPIRNLLFTSFYYNFMSNPVLKGGLNYHLLKIKYQLTILGPKI